MSRLGLERHLLAPRANKTNQYIYILLPTFKIYMYWFAKTLKNQPFLRGSSPSLRRIRSFFTRSCGAEQEMLRTYFERSRPKQGMLRTPKDLVLRRRASLKEIFDVEDLLWRKGLLKQCSLKKRPWRSRQAKHFSKRI